jgi:hypothetical protein
MKILYRNQDISGFVKTHQDCFCGQHKGCYSQRPDGSGFCFSCGKNFPSGNRTNRPTTYTKLTSTVSKSGQSNRPTIYTPAPPQRTAPILHTFSNDEILPSAFGTLKSPFCSTCERVTGVKPESWYYLGAFGNDVVFWYRDFERVVRQKKTIRFEANGFKRRRDVNPYVMEGVFTPFWGEEHLQEFVNTPLTDIFIVESEKTAIYSQFTFQWALWLGCGGSKGCTPNKIERCKHLFSEKRVFVLFDNDSGGESGTKSALQNFKCCGVSANAVSVNDLFSDAPSGCDIADYIVSVKGGVL